MRSCSICRLPLTDAEDKVCCYHEQDTTVTWADVNKRFCDCAVPAPDLGAAAAT
jgi:hypothetical protein